MASHQFHDSDSRLLVHRGVQGNFTDRGGHILGGASISGGMVCHRKIVVYGFWHPMKEMDSRRIRAHRESFVNRVHGIISADIETGSYVHGFEFFK